MPNTPLVAGATSPLNALVIGATGGIGLALVQTLATNDQVSRLFVSARNASNNANLAALIATYPERVVIIDCDILNPASLATLATAIAGQVDALHLTINATGALHDNTNQPEKSLAHVTLASLQASFAINAFAPVLLAKALLPLLRQSKANAQPTVFASLSARVGSIGDNRSGGWYSYRAAKAAQNQLLKTLSIELRRLNPQSIVLALHPGTVDTALSKPFQGNVAPAKLFSPTFAAQSLLSVIGQCSPADSGSFRAWDGSVIIW